MSTIHSTYPLSPTARLEIAQGDLTQEPVDAIVNAANARLAHGGGVAGAIAGKGGPAIQQESDAWVRAHGPVTHAQPAYTGGGRLPARYVIHAVGPVWGEGDEDRKLSAAIRGCLERAGELGLGSVAIPAISTGIFGFPLERAARVIIETIRAYYAAGPDRAPGLVRITLLGGSPLDVFLAEARRQFRPA